MIKVVAALIFNKDKILIAKRKKGDISASLKWEFPGGKVEEDEDEKKAIEREIKEEFDVTVRAKEFIVNNIYEYPNKTVDLRLYLCEYIEGEYKLIDHVEYKWINIKDLLDYDLADADIILANYVINLYK